jgi:Zn-dependent alcohol dehydrogenase
MNRRITFALLIWIVAARPASAQTAQLRMDNLDKLAAGAAEVVNVTIDEQLLQLASKFLSATRSADEREIKELVKDLKGVYVKRFEFDTDGAYSQADVDPLLKQLQTPAWSRIVGVTSTREVKNIEVFIMSEGSFIKGIAIVAAQPRELTVVNVVGPIDIDKLSRLQGQFGIPQLDLGSKPR